MTKTQIDNLGDRLKKGHATEADLRMLDEYRDSFVEAYEYVVEVLRDQLGFAPSGRQAKTSESIIAKMQREKTRLSRMQDIAGCRIIVNDTMAQYQAVDAIERALAIVKKDDRRLRPRHGYQAVHLIVRWHEKLVEIQIRTELQHLWAEVSEKLADKWGSTVKYGKVRRRFKGRF